LIFFEPDGPKKRKYANWSRCRPILLSQANQ
jgi:hypothetical protein